MNAPDYDAPEYDPFMRWTLCAERDGSSVLSCQVCGALLGLSERSAKLHKAFHDGLTVRRDVVVPSPRRDADATDLGRIAYEGYMTLRGEPLRWDALPDDDDGTYEWKKCWRAAGEAVADAVLAAHTDTKEGRDA